MVNKQTRSRYHTKRTTSMEEAGYTRKTLLCSRFPRLVRGSKGDSWSLLIICVEFWKLSYQLYFPRRHTLFAVLLYHFCDLLKLAGKRYSLEKEAVSSEIPWDREDHRWWTNKHDWNETLLTTTQISNPPVPKLVLIPNALMFCTVIISQVYLFVVGNIPLVKLVVVQIISRN